MSFDLFIRHKPIIENLSPKTILVHRQSWKVSTRLVGTQFPERPLQILLLR